MHVRISIGFYIYIYILLYITCADAPEGGVCGMSDKRHEIAFKRLVYCPTISAFGHVFYILSHIIIIIVICNELEE